MAKLMQVFVGVFLILSLGGVSRGMITDEQEKREIVIASRNAQSSLPSSEQSELAWKEAEVSPRMGDYRLWLAWSERTLFVKIQVEEDLTAADSFWETRRQDFYNIGIDLGNDSDFHYEGDDYHFTVSAPKDDDEVSATLTRTGGAPVEVKEVLKLVGERYEAGYSIQCAFDVSVLGAERLEEGQTLGFLVEQRHPKTGPGPFLMPVLWGDLILGDRTGSVDDAVWREVAGHQEREAESFRVSQTDPVMSNLISQSDLQDLERLRSRLLAPLRGDVSDERLEVLLSMNTSGRWDDLAYGSAASPDYRGTLEHLYRLNELASLYRSEGVSVEESSQIRDTIQGGLDFLLDEDFTFRNWYLNEIAIPLQMAELGLWMGDELGEKRRTRLLSVVERARRPMTGQNLIWINKINMMRGILIENPALIERSIERIASAIRLVEGEGLQPDFSFHQHGAQLYSHGYGAKFVQDNAGVIYAAEGRRFEFPREKVDLLISMVLDGNRWMTYGSFPDFGALGRLLCKPDLEASYLADTIDILKRLDTARTNELVTLGRTVREEIPDTLSGNRYFHRSEFMVQRNADYYASVKMYSRLLTGTESINGQALKNYYLPDGSTLFMRDGKEYLDVQPVWNWRMIPGITSIVSNERIPALDHRSTRTKGNTSFVGAVSDGEQGAAVYRYERDGVQAWKSYFGFDWGMVCLGTNIRSGRDEPIRTTINQAMADGDAWYYCPRSEEWKQVGEEIDLTICDARSAVWHDGFLYSIGTGQRLAASVREQEGSWAELTANGAEARVTDEVFSLSLDHGVKPEAGFYEYAVMPVDSLEGAATLVDALPFVILENSAKVQAVASSEGRAYQLIFHEAGAIELADGLRLSVDAASALLLEVAEEGRCQVTAANPIREGLDLTVTFERNGAVSSYLFELPDGWEDAGSSVTETIYLKF